MSDIDLRDALNVVRIMKEKEYTGAHDIRIGLVNKDVLTLSSRLSSCPTLRMGRVVLFREYPNSGAVTVEVAMTKEQIRREQNKGSLILTFGTIVDVPRSYLTEILFRV